MYFATTANGMSASKAVGDTFTEPMLMTYLYGRVNCLLRYVLYTKHILHCVQLQNLT